MDTFSRSWKFVCDSETDLVEWIHAVNFVKNGPLRINKRPQDDDSDEVDSDTISIEDSPDLDDSKVNSDVNWVLCRFSISPMTLSLHNTAWVHVVFWSNRQMQ